jgi:thiol peroxidase
MPEYKDAVRFKRQPVTLVGTEVKVGSEAPDFTAHQSLTDTRRLSEARGQVVVLTAAPSVDTQVCAAQLRAFNTQAASLGPDVQVWYITRDLPFALSRFCSAEGIERVVPLSDAKEREFGERYGVAIKELGLLARSTFVVDRQGKVVYREIVPELTQEPNYDAALLAVKAAL